MSMEPEEEDYQPLPAPPRDEVHPSEGELRAAKEQRQQQRPTSGEKLAGTRSFVTLGGERYPFVVNVRSVIALEAKWGSMMALGRELEKGSDGRMFTAVTDLLTSCVRELPPGVDVADLMEFDEFEAYGEAVLKALQATGLYVPPEPGANGGNGSGNADAPMRGRPTGTPSSTRPSPTGKSRRKRSSK